jgi:hypothetical protein
VVYGSRDRRLRSTWRITAALVVVLGGAIVGTSIVRRLPIPSWMEPVAVHSLAAVSAIGAVVLMARYIDDRAISAYGFDLSARWWMDLVSGVLLGVLLVGVAFGLDFVRGGVTVVDRMATGSVPSFGLGIGISVLGWILVGFWEESLFRGLFLTNAAEGLTARDLSTRTSLVGALVSSSVVYGVLHGPFGSTPDADSLVYALVMTVVMGGLFGTAYILSGELAVPIGLHIGINFAEHNLFLGSPDSMVPTVLRVERAGSGTALEFQSMDPIVVVPVFVLGYVLVAGWFYRRRGGLEANTAVVHHIQNS